MLAAEGQRWLGKASQRKKRSQERFVGLLGLEDRHLFPESRHHIGRGLLLLVLNLDEQHPVIIGVGNDIQLVDTAIGPLDDDPRLYIAQGKRGFVGGAGKKIGQPKTFATAQGYSQLKFCYLSLDVIEFAAQHPGFFGQRCYLDFEIVDEIWLVLQNLFFKAMTQNQI